MAIRARKMNPARISNAQSRLPSRETLAWFRSGLRRWFQSNRRDFPWRRCRDPYKVVIAEVMLQQTNANKVASVLPLFIRRFPNWASLANATHTQIEEEIRPLGLQQRRAKTIHMLAQAVVQLPRFPSSRRSLETLPGIGQYISNVILVTWGSHRAPFLDVNMTRLLERFFGKRELADLRDDPFLQLLSRKIVNVTDCLTLNWAILDFAATICTKQNPNHAACPIKDKCIEFMARHGSPHRETE